MTYAAALARFSQNPIVGHHFLLLGGGERQREISYIKANQKRARKKYAQETSNSPIRTEKDFKKMNKSRLDLIDKEYSIGLTPREEKELADLQKLVSDYLNEKYPLPFDLLDEMKKDLLEG